MKQAVTYVPDEIVVEENVKDLPLTQKILSRLPNVPVTVLPDSDLIRLQMASSKNAKTLGKQILALVNHKGSFLKPRADVPHYICYNYHYLYWGSNCHLECTYCILQAFLNNPLITVHVNLDDLKKELLKEFSLPQSFWRVSSGEGQLQEHWEVG